MYFIVGGSFGLEFFGMASIHNIEWRKRRN